MSRAQSSMARRKVHFEEPEPESAPAGRTNNRTKADIPGSAQRRRSESTLTRADNDVDPPVQSKRWIPPASARSQGVYDAPRSSIADAYGLPQGGEACEAVVDPSGVDEGTIRQQRTFRDVNPLPSKRVSKPTAHGWSPIPDRNRQQRFEFVEIDDDEPDMNDHVEESDNSAPGAPVLDPNNLSRIDRLRLAKDDERVMFPEIWLPREIKEEKIRRGAQFARMDQVHSDGPATANLKRIADVRLSEDEGSSKRDKKTRIEEVPDEDDPRGFYIRQQGQQGGNSRTHHATGEDAAANLSDDQVRTLTDELVRKGEQDNEHARQEYKKWRASQSKRWERQPDPVPDVFGAKDVHPEVDPSFSGNTGIRDQARNASDKGRIPHEALQAQEADLNRKEETIRHMNEALQTERKKLQQLQEDHDRREKDLQEREEVVMREEDRLARVQAREIDAVGLAIDSSWAREELGRFKERALEDLQGWLLACRWSKDEEYQRFMQELHGKLRDAEQMISGASSAMDQRTIPSSFFLNGRVPRNISSGMRAGYDTDVENQRHPDAPSLEKLKMLALVHELRKIAQEAGELYRERSSWDVIEGPKQETELKSRLELMSADFLASINDHRRKPKPNKGKGKQMEATQQGYERSGTHDPAGAAKAGIAPARRVAGPLETPMAGPSGIKHMRRPSTPGRTTRPILETTSRTNVMDVPKVIPQTIPATYFLKAVQEDDGESSFVDFSRYRYSATRP